MMSHGQPCEQTQRNPQRNRRPSVAIIVLNWNGWRYTIECLESVFRNNHPNYQVVVVDNASSDGSVERIKAWAEGELSVDDSPGHPLAYLSRPPILKPIPCVEYDRWTAEEGGDPEKERRLARSPGLVLVHCGDNLGFAGGNNVGLRYALARGDFDFVAILNNDTAIDRDALVELLATAEKNPRIGFVGSKVYYYDQPNTIQIIGGRTVPLLGIVRPVGARQEDRGQWDREVALDSLAGLFARAEMIRDVGVMDERYFLFFEEIDWFERARRRGWGLAYCWKSRIWHRESATIGHRSALADYYMTRNGIIFLRNYFPRQFWLGMLTFVGGRLLLRLLGVGGRRRRNISAVVRGAVDGVAGRSHRSYRAPTEASVLRLG